MSEQTPKESRPPKLPRKELSPETVLDSVFCEGGPMPPAKMRLRALAFFLDCILLIAVATVINWKVTLPQSHPGAYHELMGWSEEYVRWYADNSGQNHVDLAPARTAVFWMAAAFLGRVPPPGPEGEVSNELSSALLLSNEIRLLVFWIYFAFGEAFFAGSSLGKRICRLRSISTVTLAPPPVMSGIVRGGLKTIALFWIFPLIFAANFITLFFNKRRQLGHDCLSRTAVIDEKYVKLSKPAKR